MTSSSKHRKPLVWAQKKRGFSHIYTAEGVSRAIVDRRGFGLRGVTFGQHKFANVADAMEFVENLRDDAPEKE